MNILLAEDEPLIARDLSDRIRRHTPFPITALRTVNDGNAALAEIQRTKGSTDAPDLAFLDIRMPGVDGLQVARALNTACPACQIIFVTAYDEHAVAAFETAALDYLLKPVSDERLVTALQRIRIANGDNEQTHSSAELQEPTQRSQLASIKAALQTLEEKLDGADSSNTKLAWLRVGKPDQIELLNINDVLYFQADRKYTSVHTMDAEHLLNSPLGTLESQLDRTQFWRIHRSTIVNVEAIEKASRSLRGQVRLKLKNSRTVLPVSRSYAHLFKLS